MPTQKENSGESKIIIRKEAFRNMITHVLRFGNEALDESVEVMGICIGKTVNGKDIELINAIPITHGKKISLGFSSKDFNMFSDIEKRFANQNMNIVGWYSSHPGWGLFFSDSAIKTHHDFFQNGVYVNFDHTLMGKEGNLGFEIYRLNDYSDEKNNEYHKVEYDLEFPSTLDYFKWVQKLVEDTQKKAPILIKEINELAESAPDDLQEIPMSKEPILALGPIISGFQEGTSKFAELFMDQFEHQLGTWTKDIRDGALTGSELLKNSTSNMKSKISDGMSNVENWFKRNLDEIAENFKENISMYLDIRIDTQRDLIPQLSSSKDDISNDLNNLVETNFKNIMNKIENNLKDLSEKISNSSNLALNMEELIKKTSENITEVSNETEHFSNKIENIISTDISSLEQNITSEVEKLNNELNNLKETYKEMNLATEKLKKIIKP